MTKFLSIGFIGGGVDSAIGLTHYMASKLDNNFKVVAGAFSRVRDANVDSGVLYGIDPLRVYDNWRNMLKDELGRLDAVVILTPIPDHAEMVIECLLSGYAVICEKALSDSPQRIKEIINLISEKNGFLTVTYNYTGFPMVGEMREIILSGKLGEISHFQIEMPQEGYIRLNKGQLPSPQKWRLIDGTIPTVYLDLGVHMHHLIYFLIHKRPIEVVGLHSSYGNFDVIDNVSCLAKYEDDVTGQFWFGKTSAGSRNGLKVRVFGSKGSCEWYLGNFESLTLCDLEGGKIILDNGSDVTFANQKKFLRFKPGHPAGYIEAFANTYSNIAKQLNEFRAGGPMSAEVIFNLECSLDGINFLEAIASSVQNKKWVKVNK